MVLCPFVTFLFYALTLAFHYSFMCYTSFSSSIVMQQCSSLYKGFPIYFTFHLLNIRYQVSLIFFYIVPKHQPNSLVFVFTYEGNRKKVKKSCTTGDPDQSDLEECYTAFQNWAGREGTAIWVRKGEGQPPNP